MSFRSRRAYRIKRLELPEQESSYVATLVLAVLWTAALIGALVWAAS